MILLSKITVCIDPGHGGKDPGAVNGNRYEKDDVLKLAKQVGKVLDRNGIKVIYTRTTDKYDTVYQKAKFANDKKADYFISIHRNASLDKDSNGAEVIIHSFGGEKEKIAKSIQKYFAKHGFKDRGIKVNQGLVVTRETTMPAVLCEVGFITSDKDNKLFDEKLNKYADCIAKGLMDAIRLPASTYKPKANITPSSSKQDIKWLQEKLNKAVPSYTIATDGIFGFGTRIAVLNYWHKTKCQQEKATGYTVGAGTINALSKL